MAQAPVNPSLVEAQATTLSSRQRTPDHAQVQGLVYSALGQLDHGRFDLLRITDAPACRAWLATLAPAIVTADQAIAGAKGGTPADADRGLYVAFTAEGLRRLGLAPAAFDTFATPFTEGVVTPHRSRILGDVGTNDPSGWSWGGPSGEPVHLLVITLWQHDEVRTELDALLRFGDDESGPTGVAVVHSRATRLLDENKEHFGFVDGISNVRFQGELGADDAADHEYSVVEPGEIVLGCNDGSGQRPRSPAVTAVDDPEGLLGRGGDARDLGQDGTYLVLRQLRQDVPAFRRWLRDHAGDAAAEDELAAKVVGRRYDGTPLVPLDPPAPGRVPDDNTFGFCDHDQTDRSCPIGAHIRRANPRDGRRGSDGETVDGSPGAARQSDAARSAELTQTKRHRILRRGRSYGPPLGAGTVDDDGEDRGLLFVALNADIERQFEFVQSHWLGSEVFGRPGETDPLVGVAGDEPRRFTVEADASQSLRTRYDGLPQFVTVVGAGYFFLPRRQVVAYLSSLH